MKPNIALTILTLGLVQIGISQKVVTLISGGNHAFYKGSNPYQSAYNDAVDGDTIILPGGTFNAFSIDKGITILGDGYRPDSTTANDRTTVNGAFTIYENADNVHFEGIYFNNNITVQNNHKADSITLKRCEIDGSITFTGTRSTSCHSPKIIESIIRGSINLSNTYNALVSNCIIEVSVLHAYDAAIRNNIFLGSGGYLGYPYYDNAAIYYGETSLVANNIFYADAGVGIMDNTSYYLIQNNVFVITLGTYTNNTVTSNYQGQTQSGLFVNNVSGATYDYSSDFNLQLPGVYLGDDGTQCGIYGGLHPFKEGGLPFHPHYIEQTIDGFTDPSGMINVDIKVSAQDQ
ncbi:hypothetical protein [Parvicella tangerina]|uniref:Uncharacterized protein n=1 Tax=Parvicella tangerina TaxID=2829795 RepID=A0A916JNC6_9FLAO|nr:hypothetical protein [Parvicella tangerina]CAG5082511.1 hypothetical protein CRYO30217_01937 [Parvicella tangerina]